MGRVSTSPSFVDIDEAFTGLSLNSPAQQCLPTQNRFSGFPQVGLSVATCLRESGHWDDRMRGYSAMLNTGDHRYPQVRNSEVPESRVSWRT
jgi:hypothetical protein